LFSKEPIISRISTLKTKPDLLSHFW
jgi:hypothetical protein